MRIEKQRNDSVVVLSVRGRLNTERRVEALRQAIRDVVAEGRIKLVLDFERMRNIDQAGLDTLVRCLQTVRSAGGDLKIASISRRLSALFTTSGLLRVFDVYERVTDAVDAFDHLERPTHPPPATPTWRFAAAFRANLAAADTAPLC
jgi:anti-sigma B factor antagonist